MMQAEPAAHPPPDTSTEPAKRTRWVLRKTANPPHDPDQIEHVSLYDEAQTTFAHTWPDGLRTRTVFVHSEPGRNRLIRLQQWQDMTDVYEEQMRAAAAQAAAVAAAPEPEPSEQSSSDGSDVPADGSPEPEPSVSGKSGRSRK